MQLRYRLLTELEAVPETPGYWPGVPPVRRAARRLNISQVPART